MSSKLIFQMYKGHSVLNPTSYICHQNRKLVTLLTSDTRELWPAAKQNFWWAISKQQSQLGIQRQMRRVTGGKYLVQKRSFKAPTRPWKAAPLRQKAHLRFCKVLSAFDASAECEAKLFSKLVWICFESSPQLCQEVKKRSDLNHLHSLRLPFRVAPYQVAVLNELLNCRWLDLKRRVFCFFSSPDEWQSGASVVHTDVLGAGRELVVWGRVRNHMSEGTLEWFWTLESTAVSWLHRGCHLFGSTNSEGIWWKYLLLHQSLKLRKATFLLDSEQAFFGLFFPTLPLLLTTSNLDCSWRSLQKCHKLWWTQPACSLVLCCFNKLGCNI